MANELLSVRNLRVSFRTPNGKVHAVRGIDLDLHRGETLAIVGESGSGKSVTVRSIMGILAPNALVEGGEITYNGIDLLKVGEDYMQQVRGEKVAMIFQDPLSSLNPIVRIGKQLTEAMIIKGKERRKNANKNFSSLLKLVGTLADQSHGSALTPEIKADYAALRATFTRFEKLHARMEADYEAAHDNAEYARLKLGDLIARVEKNLADNKFYRKSVNEIVKLVKLTENEFVVSDSEALSRLIAEVKAASPSNAVTPLRKLDSLLEQGMNVTPPSLYHLAFHRLSGAAKLETGSVEELNRQLRAYFESNFLGKFEELLRRASAAEYARSLEQKGRVLDLLSPDSRLLTELKSAAPSMGRLKGPLNQVYSAIEQSKNRFDVYKDGRVYSFKLAMTSALKKYYENLAYNKKARRKSGADAENLIDTDALKQAAISICEALAGLYKEDLERASGGENGSEPERVTGIVNTFRDYAYYGARRITKQTARLKAIKLMDEVGIPDPHKRYYQYPFEFSGGMRQRIVIAIALSADPEILICDEPTTALDVTIQGQILELINKLKAKRNISVVFITHDLGVVANMADRVSVLYAGKIVEQGTAEDLFYNPLHPYTWALLSSMPDIDTHSELEAIPGTPPNMIHPPKGDAFAERNRYALKLDFEQMPPLVKVSETHAAATWLLHPDAPEAKPPAIVTERIERMLKMREADSAEVKHDKE